MAQENTGAFVCLHMPYKQSLLLQRHTLSKSVQWAQRTHKGIPEAGPGWGHGSMLPSRARLGSGGAVRDRSGEGCRSPPPRRQGLGRWGRTLTRCPAGLQAEQDGVPVFKFPRWRVLPQRQGPTITVLSKNCSFYTMKQPKKPHSNLGMSLEIPTGAAARGNP